MTTRWLSTHVAPQVCPELERCIADCDAENAANREQIWEIRSECSDTYVERGFETGATASTNAVWRPRTRARLGRRPIISAATSGSRPWIDPLVFARTDLGEVSVRLADLDELFASAGPCPEPCPDSSVPVWSASATGLSKYTP